MYCVQSCHVEWIGNPVAVEHHKKYYEAVKVNEEEVCEAPQTFMVLALFRTSRYICTCMTGVS